MLPYHDGPVIRKNIITKILFASCSAKISEYTVYVWAQLSTTLVVLQQSELTTVQGKTFKGETSLIFVLVHSTPNVFPWMFGHVDWQYKHTNMLPWRFSHEWPIFSLTAKVFPFESFALYCIHNNCHIMFLVSILRYKGLYKYVGKILLWCLIAFKTC